MRKEVWRPVVGYEKWYEVSNKGRVRRIGGKILKQRPNQQGYPLTTICTNGKVRTIAVHRMVAKAFVPNPRGVKCVNHIDEVKTNNNAENLEWVTHTENNNHGTFKERVANTLREYYKTHPYAVAKPVRCVETGIVYPSITKAGEAMGIDLKAISYCLNKGTKNSTSGGYHWEFVEKGELYATAL